MGQIVGLNAKCKRANLSAIQEGGSLASYKPAAGEYILISTDNSMTADGQGDFDYYVIGEGETKTIKELELRPVNVIYVKGKSKTLSSLDIVSSKVVANKQARGTVGSEIEFANWTGMSYYRFDNPQKLSNSYVITGKTSTQKASSLIQFVDSSNIITRLLEISTSENTVYTDEVSFLEGEVACYITYLTSYGLTIQFYEAQKIEDSIEDIKEDIEVLNGLKSNVNAIEDILFDDGYIDVTSLFSWTNNGYINSSGNVTSSSVQKYSNFVDVSTFGNSMWLTLEILTNSNLGQRYVFYNEDKTVLEVNRFPLGSQTGHALRKITIPEGAKYVRTSLYMDDSYEEFEAKYEIPNNLTPLIEAHNELSEEVDAVMNGDGDIDITNDFVFTPGYFIGYANGNMTASTVNSASGFVNVEKFKSIELTVDATASNVSQGLAFYNGNKEFITGYKCAVSSTTTFKVETYNIPDNAVYVRTSYWTDISDKGNQPFFCKGRNALMTTIKAMTGNSKTNGDYKEEPLIGSPSIYLAEDTENESLDNKTVAEIYERYDAMVSDYPAYIKRVEDLCSITSGGSSWDVRIYKLGFNKLILRDEEGTNDDTYDNLYDDTMDNKRTILITCGVHGNEKTPWWGTMLAIEDLLSSNDDWAKYIRANFFFYVIPCMNPYGLDNRSRYNENNQDLNRAAGRNETARVALGQWIESMKDRLYYWVDVHGSQGRWAYVPGAAFMPFYHQVQQMTYKMTQALASRFGEIWAGVDSGFTRYFPYLFMELGGWIEGAMAYDIYNATGVNEHALETPDDINSGAIGTNRGVGCAVTKMLLWNSIMILGSTSLVRKPYTCNLAGTISASGTLKLTRKQYGDVYNADIVDGKFSIAVPNGLYTASCDGYTITNNTVLADQDRTIVFNVE